MSSCLISGCSETSTRSNGGKVVLVSSSLLGIPVYCALVVSVARLISITIRLLIILSIQASTSFQSNSNHPSIQKVSATRADFKQTSSSNIIFISVCKASFDYYPLSNISTSRNKRTSWQNLEFLSFVHHGINIHHDKMRCRTSWMYVVLIKYGINVHHGLFWITYVRTSWNKHRTSWKLMNSTASVHVLLFDSG